MTFTLQMKIVNDNPDFTEMATREEREAEDWPERLARIQKSWYGDACVDIADVLKMVGNRITRGEKAGDVRDLGGVKCGTWSIEE